MLYGDKVGLRPVEEEDLPNLVRWRNDPQTRPKFYTPFLISISGQKKWYQGLLKDESRRYFIIVRLEDDVPVGSIGLHLIDDYNRDAHTGPIMIDPMQRGGRLAADAVRTLMQYAFEELNLRRLYFEFLAANQATHQLTVKLGLRHEATARKAVFVNGEFQDVIHMALLREEWQASQRRDADRGRLS